jgi:hypothetical protein
LGEITDQFQEQHVLVTASYGRRVPLPSPMTFRMIAGFTYDRSYFLPLPEPGYTTSIPPNLTLSYPWIGVTLFREAYVTAHDMDKLGRTEDFDLGREFNARVGFSSPAFGADETAEVVELSWRAGFNPGAGQIVTLDTDATGRFTSTGLENGILSATVRYYRRDNDWSLFYIGLRGTAVDRLDGNHQLLLGGDNGLRAPFGEGETALILECLDEAINGKCIRIRGRRRVERRRVRKTTAADHAARRGQRADRARGVDSRQVAHAFAADQVGAGMAGAELATLWQRHARRVERAPANVVKCNGQKI